MLTAECVFSENWMINEDSRNIMIKAGLRDVLTFNYEQCELERIGISGYGFGFNPKDSLRLFVIDSSSKRNPVSISEITINENPKPASVILKAQVDQTHWEIISVALATEFNERLKKQKRKIGTWKKGKSPVTEQFGKEAVVLAWAIEELGSSDVRQVRKAISNWKALSPEERWWLYLMANANCGTWPDGKGKGWRKSIGFALGDFGFEKDNFSDFSTINNNSE